MSAFYFSLSRKDARDPASEKTAAPVATTSSSVAASAVGGAIAAINRAIKPGFCPTLGTHEHNSGCTNDLNNTSAADLIFADCKAASGGTWNGIAQFTLATGVAVRCGSGAWPDDVTVQRQFVDEHSHGASGSWMDSQITVTVDHASTGGTLFNFDTVTIIPTINSGYGTTVTLGKSSEVTQVSLAEHLWALKSNVSIFDQTAMGTLKVASTTSGRSVSGSLTMYDNTAMVVGMTKMSDVLYSDTCCPPVSGTITTTYQKGMNSAPSPGGLALVGKTETLTITGCGIGTLIDATGNSSSVALGCY